MSESTETSARFQFGLKSLLLLTIYVAVVCSLFASMGWIPLAVLIRSPLLGVLILLPFFAFTLVSCIACCNKLFGAALGWGMLALLWLFFMLPNLSTAGESARQMACCNNLKQIGVALHNYHSAHGCFPPAYIADESGKPMHSWRVLLLPYCELEGLYDAYNFDEAWDGPNNSTLTAREPSTFRCPSFDPRTPAQELETNYVLITGPGTMWPDEKGPKIDDATDGPSQTLMVVEVVNSAIHWMEPRDLDLSTMETKINPQKGLGVSSNHPGGANVLFVDGSGRFIVEELTPEQLKALLTRDGGEEIDPDEL